MGQLRRLARPAKLDAEDAVPLGLAMCIPLVARQRASNRLLVITVKAIRVAATQQQTEKKNEIHIDINKKRNVYL